ncbi:hypothetical protein XAP412_340003 [Xanthomonas phaseoli pv. phaseoli]|nr:hypothetical protein XAP6984_400003 [Xanthomonas phaseoli pv. phaseoli]SON84295.1 hypothetical protein XAP412_340003 [Xanthomonas phaseoli pv. phaseoli]
MLRSTLAACFVDLQFPLQHQRAHGMRSHRMSYRFDRDFRKVHARVDDSACCTGCSIMRISAAFALAPIRLKNFVSDTFALEHLRALVLLCS